MKKEQVEALLHAVAATHDIEIDCAECLARMPALAESRAAGGPTPEDLRLAEEHERLCQSCSEECAALAEAIKSESGS